MAHLELRFLGSFQATLDGTPLTGFPSNKTRALLVFLSMEAKRTHPRDALLDLLWCEFPQVKAQANLRNALSRLRKIFGDAGSPAPFFTITRDFVQFNSSDEVFLDVVAFEELAGKTGGRFIRKGRGKLPKRETRGTKERPEGIGIFRDPF